MPLEKEILNSNGCGLFISLAHFFINIVFRLFRPVALPFLNFLIAERFSLLLVGSIIKEFSNLSFR